MEGHLADADGARRAPDRGGVVVFVFGRENGLFSFSDLLAGISPPPWVDTGLTGPANVLYDGSDGTHRLYVSGQALGRDPNLLYRATLDSVRAGLPQEQWEELRGDNVFPAFEAGYADPATKREPFATLLIDPVSSAGGGQTMYTLGSGDTLWVSRDGGHSWRRDDSAPGLVSSVWLSRGRRRVYATVDGGPTVPPVLWKRLTSSGVFPGARIVRSDLRVTCQGPPGFPGAITPGSTFPIGDTVLSCSATDVFGNVTNRSFTVSVRDTRPPTLVVPPDITLTTGCTSSQNIGTATATDVASPPVTITSNRPSIFKAGTTAVTWTARDARGNTATGTQQVTVVLNTDSSCCPTGTNIIRGTAGNDTLNGTSGRDCILGLGGQDTINGNGGDDLISGGDGDDVINGGDGNDVVFGNAGQDSLTGGLRQRHPRRRRRRRRLPRRRRRRRLRGGLGQDQLFGENNNDQLFGDDGDDRLDGGPGNDTLNGGAGNDTCAGGTGTNTLTSCP